MKTHVTRALALIVSAAMLQACGGGGSTGGGGSSTAGTTITTITLAGSNGDLSKYLGTWVSDCGFKLNIGQVGGNAVTGVVNRFVFTTVSGSAITGVLTSTEYTAFDCTGSSTISSQNVRLTYVSNLLATGSTGTTFFTGTADSVTVGQVGSSSTTSMVTGFRDSFGKFQLTPSLPFSTANMVYTKQLAFTSGS